MLVPPGGLEPTSGKSWIRRWILYLLGFTWKPFTSHSLPTGSQCKSSAQFPPEHNSNQVISTVYWTTRAVTKNVHLTVKAHSINQWPLAHIQHSTTREGGSGGRPLMHMLPHPEGCLVDGMEGSSVYLPFPSDLYLTRVSCKSAAEAVSLWVTPFWSHSCPDILIVALEECDLISHPVSRRL